MKKLIFLFAFLPFVAGASVEMTRVNPELFINRPETDFSRIAGKDETRKKQLVEYLFQHDELNHEGSKAFEKTASFDAYYQAFGPRFLLIDLDRDGIFELVFNGYVAQFDEREHVEIYDCKTGVPKKIYDELGHLLAYKIQPNTQEVLLYHHQYPCCLNASHNLDRLRLVEGKIQLLKRFFVGRDNADMKGEFFPKKVVFTNKYYKTKQMTELRWSGEVIEKDAWIRRTPENVIAHYDSAAVYTILAKEKGWYFVLMKTPPKQENGGKVINPANFLETHIYGWLNRKL